MSARHYQFLLECIKDFKAVASAYDLPLIVRVGEAIQVFEDICREVSVVRIFAHQETWNSWTYQRDKAVRRWSRERGIPFSEHPHTGVIRRLSHRDGWASKWYHFMKTEPHLPPSHKGAAYLRSDDFPSATSLCLADDGIIEAQKGGRTHALTSLQSFLYERGEHYTREMSSPYSASTSCSRISPYLAFGVLSVREAFHAGEKRRDELQSLPPSARGKWLSALHSFLGRLRWHCHFIQKLEDEPRIEISNFHSAYDGLREETHKPEWLMAWEKGLTGYPMIDACMRSLIATGWINFRMRAMLMSFASYHLWLHWREPALHLARLFVDYEPGIHYAQSQMQSGTTGINTIRIYNPLKQSLDHDPKGVFIRKWIPELASFSDTDIHTPWRSPHFRHLYPPPIVDHDTARKAAATKLYALRRATTHRLEANDIAERHASRKSTREKRPSKKMKISPFQLGFKF
jgi:deoxyribodipyrimidine photo-lyase